MTEELTQYGTERKAIEHQNNLAAKLKYANATIERLTMEAIGFAKQHIREEDEILTLEARLHDERETVAQLTADNKELRDERTRSEDALSKSHEREKHLDDSLKLAQKRLDLAGVLADRDSMTQADEVRDALDVILTAQVLPEQCGHCGAMLDPDEKLCGVCFTDVGKVEQQAHRDHMAGV